MTDVIRALNEEGISIFEKFIEHGAIGEIPFYLLDDDEMSNELQWSAKIEKRDFVDSMDFGNYLNSALVDCDPRAISYNSGIWTWLALYFFDQLSPADATGARKPGKAHRHVLKIENFRHVYRHLVRTPYILSRDHGGNASVLLTKPLHTHGELSEQILSRQELTATPSIMSAIYLLYFDKIKNKPKSGAGSRNRAGVVLRLVDILKQFGATYDLHSLSGEQIVQLLPEEFNKWETV